jgi:hypothetical protein
MSVVFPPPLSFFRVISVDTADPRQKALFNGAQKLLGIVMTVCQAIGYVLSGAYGTLEVSVLFEFVHFIRLDGEVPTRKVLCFVHLLVVYFLQNFGINFISVPRFWGTNFEFGI